MFCSIFKVLGETFIIVVDKLLGKKCKGAEKSNKCYYHTLKYITWYTIVFFSACSANSNAQKWITVFLFTTPGCTKGSMPGSVQRIMGVAGIEFR